MLEFGQTDADHVVELQVSGPDDFNNLWPLESKENQQAGSRLKNTRVVLPNGTTRRLEQLPGKYFKIIGFER
jgi:5-methylcytosine-specific restriction endonuclease McrA